MEARIYKYAVPMEPEFELEMHRPHTFLKLEVQHKQLCFWALVYSEEPMTKQKFRLVGTGQPIHLDSLGIHVGSTLLAEGALVLHLFQVSE